MEKQANVRQGWLVGKLRVAFNREKEPRTTAKSK
jgi:hypothetical protein